MPWLGEAQQRVRTARLAGRMPHALLIIAPPGLGAEQLAGWIAAFVLCESAAVRPCDVCRSCRLLRADSHPDLHVVRIEAEAKQIKVEQIRELIDALSLSSYCGGYKVAVIEGAEALNASGANAFLKTLEEPAGDTLLVMIARPNHRLPATIASRCLRLTLRPPALHTAKSWLAAHAASKDPWDAALALAGGAPLLAAQLQAEGLSTIDADMRRDLGELARDSADITLVADRWVRSNPGVRLAWLENWITQRVLAALKVPDSHQTAEPVRLPAALLKPKIRSLFELLDAARDLRRLAATGLNQQLAIEALLLGGRTALAD
jgi:DNA polymerase-3 subunit delta'